MRKAAPLLLIGALALTACGTRSTLHADPSVNPLDAWGKRVSVQSHADEIRLAPHATGLSPNQKAALSALLARWAGSEGGEITIQAPSDGGDAAVAYRAAAGAQAWLTANGAPEHAVRLVGYDAAGVAGAPIVVGYLRHSVTTPVCGRSWENLSATGDNIAYDNFGCALNANLAAQVADPADLVTPRNMTPADAQRRATVYEQYRSGEMDADEESTAAGQVSRVVTQ